MADFQKLLHADMTRKQFLKVCGIGIVSIFGITGILKELTSHAASPSASAEPEDGSISGSAAVVTDSSASGNGAVKFGTNPSWPDATNTGVPAGTTYGTVKDGGGAELYVRTTGNGQVIDGWHFTGGARLVVLHNDVIIRNSLFDAVGAGSSLVNFCLITATGNTGTVIEHCEVNGSNATAGSVSVNNATVRYCNMHGGGDGIDFGDNTTVDWCWIHDPSTREGTHADGMQSYQGAANVSITNTVIDNPLDQTSCINMGDRGESATNWLIQRVKFAGGGYSLIGIGSPTVFSDIQVKDCVWSKKYWDTCGRYGPTEFTGSPFGTDGNVWSGNTWDDATVLEAP